MVYAPASPRSGRWKRSSPRTAGAPRSSRARPSLLVLSSLALLTLALAAACAGSEPSTKRPILVLPVRSHWVSAPLAEAVARSLPDALVRAGFAVTVMMPDSPEYRLGVSEGWLNPDDLIGDRAQTARHALATRTGCDASLTAEVTQRESETVLRGELAGAVSHKQAVVSVTVPVGTKDQGGAVKSGGFGTEVPKQPSGMSRDELAQTLSRDLAAKLTSEIWTEAGADEAGRRMGAPERFAAGQTALAAGRYQDAAAEFAAALAGQPDKPDYLSSAADAAIVRGRAVEALPLLKRLSELKPGDRDVMLRMGDAALLAGQPDQAEAAFLDAVAIEPADARALEGVARAARAKGDFARAETYYTDVLSRMGLYRPAGQVAVSAAPLAGAGPTVETTHEGGMNVRLPGLLAHQSDDTIRLWLPAAPPDAAHLAIGQVYLRNGFYPAGVRSLLLYQTPGRSAYSDQDYLTLAADLDKGGEAIASRVGTIAEKPVRELTGDALNAELEALHDQSDALATLAERMKVSAKLDPAHRYRVLAYNLLNQSDFEALMYFQTHDPDRQRRSDLLREAFRKARSQAQDLASDLSGTASGARGNGPAASG